MGEGGRYNCVSDFRSSWGHARGSAQRRGSSQKGHSPVKSRVSASLNMYPSKLATLGMCTMKGREGGKKREIIIPVT